MDRRRCSGAPDKPSTHQIRLVFPLHHPPFVQHGEGYRLKESSKWTPSVFCRTVRTLDRLAADGLPFDPSICMRLLTGMPVCSSSA